MSAFGIIEEYEKKRPITDRDRKLRVIVKKKKSDNNFKTTNKENDKTPRKASSVYDDAEYSISDLNDSFNRSINRSSIIPNGVSKLNLSNLGTAGKYDYITTRRENEKVHVNDIMIPSSSRGKEEKYDYLKIESIKPNESNIQYKEQVPTSQTTNINSEKRSSGNLLTNTLYFIGGALSVGTIAYFLGKKGK